MHYFCHLQGLPGVLHRARVCQSVQRTGPVGQPAQPHSHRHQGIQTLRCGDQIRPTAGESIQYRREKRDTERLVGNWACRQSAILLRYSHYNDNQSGRVSRQLWYSRTRHIMIPSFSSECEPVVNKRRLVFN